MADSKVRRLAPAPPGRASAIEIHHQRRRNVGTACSSCKSRKLKCSGTSPCTNCLKSNLECTLDENTDRRRRGVLKRRIDQLEEKEDLLARLVGILRDSNTHRTIQLLNLIRDDTSLAEIKRYLDTKFQRLDSKKTPDLMDVCDDMHHPLQQTESPLMRRILDAKRLSDIPLFQVPARPWTNVTDDHDFVSHLISLWFTWYHPFFNWIDRDLFIRDMQSGNLEAKFCSPFLVNTILASACAYSDYPEAFAVPKDILSKGAHFYDEAKRLLEKEEGRITITTGQGLGVLWAWASMTGKDRHGWIYQSQLAFAVQELSQSHAVLCHAVLDTLFDEDTRRLTRVISNTVWGLFNMATAHALSNKKIPWIKPPQRLPLPSISHEPKTDKWYPYPHQSEGIQAHTTCLFSALCSLNRIAYEMSQLFFRGEVRLSRLKMERKAEELQSRLLGWARYLPTCLKEEKSVEVPHVLQLYMYQHAIIMTIDDFLRSPMNYNNTTNTNHNYNPVFDYLPTIRISPEHAQEEFLSSARRISQLVRIHRTLWGVDRMPMDNVEWITAALLALLERLDEPNNRDAFVNLSVSLKHFPRRLSKIKAILRRIQSAAREMDAVLPNETDSLFSDLETDSMYSGTTFSSRLTTL